MVIKPVVTLYKILLISVWIIHTCAFTGMLKIGHLNQWKSPNTASPPTLIGASSFILEAQRGSAKDQQREFMSKQDTDISDEVEERPSKWDPSLLQLQNQQTPSAQQRAQILTSLQGLTLAVSLTFLATLFVSQGKLVAAPPPTRPTVIINADELLQQEWQRLVDENDGHYFLDE